MANIILPFKQKEIYLGLAEISGLLRIVDNTLEIEYKVKDTTLGFLDSSVKSCRIPLRIIDSVEVEKKWFSGKLEVTFIRIPDLDNPFQLEGNRIITSVRKKDLEKARAFRSQLMHKVLELKLDDLDDSEEYTSRPKHTSRMKETQSEKERFKNRNHNSQEKFGGLKNMLRSE